MFTPVPGEMIQFDEHIFQMGWFNHQLDFFSDKEHHRQKTSMTLNKSHRLKMYLLFADGVFPTVDQYLTVDSWSLFFSQASQPLIF